MPSINIEFSSLSIADPKQETKPIKPEPFLPAPPAASTGYDSRTFGSDISNTGKADNSGFGGGFGGGFGDSKVDTANVKMEKDIRTSSAITKFLSRGGSRGR